MEGSGHRKRSMSSGVPESASKKKRYGCKFQKKWCKAFPWITASSAGPEFCYCVPCKSNFSVKSGGLYDVKKHTQTELHKKCATAVKGTSAMQNFLVSSAGHLLRQVTRSETLFSNFVVEHNLPFAVADHFSDLCKKMFPDSKTAENFACKRTKCTQIVKQAIAPYLTDKLIKHCQENPFSILCDESNDRSASKCFVLLVRIYDKDMQSVVTRFLDMPIVNIGTACNLFDAIDKCFSLHKIPWENVIGFMSDNCSVMKGRNNSVVSRIRDKQPNLIDIGCICHLANLCCVAGVKELPVPIDEIVVDIFYHFQNR